MREYLSVNYVLSVLLGCGSLDADFFVEELNNWNIISFEEVHEEVSNHIDNYCSNPLLINVYIYVLYMLSYEKACREIEIDFGRLNLEPEFFINCLDSHFYINNNGDVQKFYNIGEFNAFLKEYKRRLENS
ncbi:MAG: hypothetical protein ACK5WP_09530 [Neisseriaceae bacterium]